MSYVVCFLIFAFACIAGVMSGHTKMQSYQNYSSMESNQSMLLEIPPYRSFMGYSKPASMSSSMDKQLQSIAEKYGMNVSDMYQWYDMIQNNMSVNPDEMVNMISRLASAAADERRGVHPDPSSVPPKMPSLGGFPPNYPSSMSSFMNSMQSMVKSHSQMNPPPMHMKMPYNMHPSLHRREPEPADGLINSMKNDLVSNMQSAYNNVMGFMDRYIPETSQSMKNIVNDVMGSTNNIAQKMDSKAGRLADQMNSNMRYMMSELM